MQIDIPVGISKEKKSPKVRKRFLNESKEEELERLKFYVLYSYYHNFFVDAMERK